MHQYLVLDKKETEPVDPLPFIRIKKTMFWAPETRAVNSLFGSTVSVFTGRIEKLEESLYLSGWLSWTVTLDYKKSNENEKVNEKYKIRQKFQS